MPVKAALITGSAIRIGREIALKMAENGYDIALHYFSSDSEAEKTAEEIRAKKVKCLTFKANLANHKEVIGLSEQVFKEFSEISLLVNSASIFGQQSFLETSEQDFDSHIDINFKAPFFLSQQYAIKNKGKGHIINILDSKISGTMEKRFAYLLSKKSLGDFTYMAARVLGDNIRVNGIAVGTTEISRELDKIYLENLKKRLPLRRPASLDDITQAVIMLENHKGITGQVINIDGGESVL